MSKPQRCQTLSPIAVSQQTWRGAGSGGFKPLTSFGNDELLIDGYLREAKSLIIVGYSEKLEVGRGFSKMLWLLSLALGSWPCVHAQAPLGASSLPLERVLLLPGASGRAGRVQSSQFRVPSCPKHRSRLWS